MSGLRAAPKPADYDGKEANVGVRGASSEPAPLFAQVKLKSAPKPADYDGKEANVGFKQAEHNAPQFSGAALRHVDDPENRPAAHENDQSAAAAVYDASRLRHVDGQN
eukprot:TRINITY_DN791_c0_g1_i1.p1 TRINITY_DN791_c0_g1~~TRINITY_DN791_c0_g1_i1.p1  ORF type:complete len:108 (-),score=49.69 TRINITY_DN791_c0_g1_i1:173-496(-)